MASAQQTTILPLTSSDLFKAADNYQKGVYDKAFEDFKALSITGDANAIYGTGNMLAGSLGTTVIATMMTSVHIYTLSYVQNIVVGSRLAVGMLALLGLVNFFLFRKLFKSGK